MKLSDMLKRHKETADATTSSIKGDDDPRLVDPYWGSRRGLSPAPHRTGRREEQTYPPTPGLDAAGDPRGTITILPITGVTVDGRMWRPVTRAGLADPTNWAAATGPAGETIYTPLEEVLKRRSQRVKLLKAARGTLPHAGPPDAHLGAVSD